MEIVFNILYRGTTAVKIFFFNPEWRGLFSILYWFVYFCHFVVPLSPLLVTTQAADAVSITLNWIPPTDVYSGFSVSYKEVGAPVDVPAGTTPSSVDQLEVTGLLPATTYEFSVVTVSGTDELEEISAPSMATGRTGLYFFCLTTLSADCLLFV